MHETSLSKTTPGLPAAEHADPTVEPKIPSIRSHAVDFMLSDGTIAPEKAASMVFDPRTAARQAAEMRDIFTSTTWTRAESLRLVQTLNESGVAVSEIIPLFKRYGDGFVSLYYDFYAGDDTAQSFGQFQEVEHTFRDCLERANAIFLKEDPKLPQSNHCLEIWSGFKAEDLEAGIDIFAELTHEHGTGASSLYRAWGDHASVNEMGSRALLKAAAAAAGSPRKDTLAAICNHLPTQHQDALCTLILTAPEDSAYILERMPAEGFSRDPEKYLSIVERFKGFSAVVFHWFDRQVETLPEAAFDRLEKLFGSMEISGDENAPIEQWLKLSLDESPQKRLGMLARIESLVGACGPYFEAFGKHFGNEVLGFFEAHRKEAEKLMAELAAADLDDDAMEVIASYPWGESARKVSQTRRLLAHSAFGAAELVSSFQTGAARSHAAFAMKLVEELSGHAAPVLKHFNAALIKKHPELALRTARLISPYGNEVAADIPQDAILEQPERFNELLDQYGTATWGLIGAFKGKLFEKADELAPLLEEYCRLTTDGAGEFFFRVPAELWDTAQMRRLAGRYGHATGSEYDCRHADFSFQREDELWERSFSRAREALSAYHFGRYCTIRGGKISTSFLDELVDNQTTTIRSSEDSAAAAIAAYDHNHAFQGESNLLRLMEVNVRMKLYLREVQAAPEIAEHFEQSAAKHGRPHRFGMVTAHGHEKGVRLREPLVATAAPDSAVSSHDQLTVNHEDLLTRIGRTVSHGGDFVLASCLSARGGYGADNFLTRFKGLAPHLVFFGTRIATSIGNINFSPVHDTNSVVEVTFAGPHRKRVTV